MAARISSPTDRILRTLFRGVRNDVKRSYNGTYRAAVCKTLKHPLAVEEMSAVKQLKNSQVLGC